MTQNTGPIIGKIVREYNGEVEITRKATMRDLSLAMDRAALERKVAAKVMSKPNSIGGSND